MAVNSPVLFVSYSAPKKAGKCWSKITGPNTSSKYLPFLKMTAPNPAPCFGLSPLASAMAAEAFFASLPKRLTDDEQELALRLEQVGTAAKRVAGPKSDRESRAGRELERHWACVAAHEARL